MNKNDFKNEIRMLPLARIELNEGQLPGLPANPRQIQKDKFAKLKKNIADYPEMLEWRSLLVYPLDNGNYIIIGGNMRYRAMQELGHTEAPAVIIPKETPVEKLQAYTILDNNGFGQWDWDALANEWPEDLLGDWGLDLIKDWGDVPEEDATAYEDEYSEEDAKNAPLRCCEGDVWQLGDHRLMCGDSTNNECVKTLMGGGICRFITDRPPLQCKLRGRHERQNEDCQR